MKWGDYINQVNGLKLEKHYNEMMNSFDIQDADTKVL